MSDAEYRVNKVAREAMFLRYKKVADGSSLAPSVESVRAECEAARQTGGEAAYDATLARHVEQQAEIDVLAQQLVSLFPYVKEGDTQHTEIMDRFTAAHEQGGHDGLKQAYLDVISEKKAANAEWEEEKPFHDRIKAAGGGTSFGSRFAIPRAVATGKWNSKNPADRAAGRAVYLASLREAAQISEAAGERVDRDRALRAEAEKMIARVGELGGDAKAAAAPALSAYHAAYDAVEAETRAAIAKAAGVGDLPPDVLGYSADDFDTLMMRAILMSKSGGDDPDAILARREDWQKRLDKSSYERIRDTQREIDRGKGGVAGFTA